MNRKYRKTVIAGNWKMHKTVSETRDFLETLKSALPRTRRCSVVLCVPYTVIPAAGKHLKDSSRISIGAQNLHWSEEGAFTGEISPSMLAELDVKYVIVGHSERRKLFGESDLDVNRKTKAALNAGLRPILCVGEDRMQRELNVSSEHVACQLKAALSGISPEEVRKVIIAYEPVWAGSDEKDASLTQAGPVCTEIRGMLRTLYGSRTARSTSILFAGPMDESNASALLDQEDVDGGLVGEASLAPDRFLEIIRAASRE